MLNSLNRKPNKNDNCVLVDRYLLYRIGSLDLVVIWLAQVSQQRLLDTAST